MYKDLNAVQMAWVKAVERKTGKRVKVESPEDVRILARLNVQTFAPETIIYEETEVENG